MKACVIGSEVTPRTAQSQSGLCVLRIQNWYIAANAPGFSVLSFAFGVRLRKPGTELASDAGIGDEAENGCRFDTAALGLTNFGRINDQNEIRPFSN